MYSVQCPPYTSEEHLKTNTKRTLSREELFVLQHDCEKDKQEILVLNRRQHFRGLSSPLALQPQAPFHSWSLLLLWPSVFEKSISGKKIRWEVVRQTEKSKKTLYTSRWPFSQSLPHFLSWTCALLCRVLGAQEISQKSNWSLYVLLPIRADLLYRRQISYTACYVYV